MNLCGTRRGAATPAAFSERSGSTNCNTILLPRMHGATPERASKDPRTQSVPRWSLRPLNAKRQHDDLGWVSHPLSATFGRKSATFRPPLLHRTRRAAAPGPRYVCIPWSSRVRLRAQINANGNRASTSAATELLGSPLCVRILRVRSLKAQVFGPRAAEALRRAPLAAGLVPLTSP